MTLSPNTSSLPAASRVLSAPPQQIKPKASGAKTPSKSWVQVGALPFWAGLILSGAWVVMVLAIVAGSGPTHMFGGLPLVNWAIGISAIVSPVALIWMVAAYLQRAADIKAVADPLRRQLSIITGESGAAEARIRRFNQAIREQIDLLKNAQGMTEGDLNAVMERVRQHRDELERFENTSIHQVKEIQEIVRRNMQQVEQLMDDKFTMLRVLDGKLVQNGDAVARQTEAVRDQVAGLLQEIESHGAQVTDALERATKDSRALADMSRVQESTLIGASNTVADVLGGLSGKIDLSTAQFLERASTARQEAERLAGALDAQTRSLEEFSVHLPSRVGEAEAVMRGVADRLYASEKLAREQAVVLSDSLSAQVDGLQDFMDRFTSRFVDLDGRLAQRRGDLDAMAGQIGDTTAEFVQAWEQSIFDLNDRTGQTLERFTTLSNQNQREASQIAEQLATTSAQYEDAATRINGLTADSRAQMAAMSADIATSLAQFETLDAASRQAGVEVEARATAAMQNLQQVLDRLLVARESTQSVGEILIKDLQGAVVQNEQLIGRLSEAAQMSVHALGVATDLLGKREGDLAGQAQATEATLKDVAAQIQQQAQQAEAGLRQQTENLRRLLDDTQSQISATEQKLQSLAESAVAPVQTAVQQMDVSADRGLQSLIRYGDGLQGQLIQLQSFHAKVGDLGQDLSCMTADNLSAIEQLQTRFETARAAQEQAARDTLLQFADLSDRLHRETAGLDGQAAQAVATLQNAATRVGEESYQMLQNAENAGAKIQSIGHHLRDEATQIRAILDAQAADLRADLARTESQFAGLGDVLQQRAEAASAVIDRVAAHYADTTGHVMQDLDARVAHIGQASDQIEAKTSMASAALAAQLQALSGGVNQLDTQATQIGETSGRALQNLSALNEKLALTGETANAHAQTILRNLGETGGAFVQQKDALAEAAQQAAGLVQQAGEALAQQTLRLLDGSQLIDQNVRNLTSITATSAEQATRIRTTMEEQNQKLAAQLADSVGTLETVGGKLQNVATQAATGADEASARFAAMTDTAIARLGISQQDLQTVAAQAETSLAAFGTNITQQAASLAVIGDQLDEQHRALAATSDDQRARLEALFGRLEAAHGQASAVAERSIANLSDSLMRIQSHLGVVGEASQDVVAQVRNATSGFASESLQLVHNAQAAEQQARTVLGTTAALQAEAQKLREAMQAEALQAGATLGDLLGKLADGGRDLRDLNGATRESLAGTHATLLNQTEQLGIVMQNIGDRQNTLTAALDAQKETLDGLLARLNAAQEETTVVAERSVISLTDGVQALTQQTGAMEAQVLTAVTQVQAANAAFATESGQLAANAEAVEQQARMMVAVTADAQNQTRQMREAVTGESARASETLEALFIKLNASGTQLRDLAIGSESALRGLCDGLAHQGGDVSVLLQQILERQALLTSALQEQREVLGGLLGRLNLAQDETVVIAERSVARLTDETQNLTRQVEIIDAQAQRAVGSVTAAVEGFATESNVLIAHAREAEHQAHVVLTSATEAQVKMGQAANDLQGDSARIGEQFDRLIHQLVAGGAALRDLGATTRESLTETHDTVLRQTETLDTTMRKIGERQDGLTVALDAQGQALDGLLTRLNAAQDETVTLAEHSVARLTQGAQKIAQQTDNIGEHAQIALASLQVVGTGFAEQAAQISAQAEQATQSLRGAAATTGDMRQQAQDLHAAIQAESAAAIGHMVATVAQLDVAKDQLQKQSLSAIQTMDQTALHFATVTRTSAESMQTHAGTLTETHDTVLRQTETLDTTMRKIGERQDGLTVALDAQGQALDGLLTRLNAAQDETVTLAEHSVARLTQGAQKIAQQTDNIGEHAQIALASLQVVGTGFAEQAAQISAQAEQATQSLRGAAATTGDMRQQAQDLHAAIQAESAAAIGHMVATVAQLDVAKDQLQKQSLSAIQTMDQTALHFATVTRTSAESMQTHAGTLTETLDTAETQLASASEKMRGNLKLVGDVGDQTEMQARQLADVAEYATNRLVALRETLVDSDREGQQILIQTSARIVDVKASLRNELQALAALAQQTADQVATASQGIVADNDTLRASLALSAASLAQAADQVRDETVRVPATLERSTAQIESATRLLKAQTDEADSILIGTADRFIGVTVSARESMIDDMRRVSLTAEQANDVLGHFSATLAAQVTAIQLNAAHLSDEQTALVAKASDSVAQLAAASDRLAHLRSDATQTAAKLACEFNAIDQRATETSQRLLQTSEIMISSGEALAKVSQRTEGQMIGASAEFRQQLEAIRSGMQEQMDAIHGGLAKITTQLERASVTLRSTTSETVADVDMIAQRLDQTGRNAATILTDKTAHVRGATEDVAKLLSGFGDQLDVLLDRLALAGDGLRRQEGGAVEKLQNVLQHLGAVAERLESSRVLATDVSAQTVARLNEVVEVVQRDMHNLTNGTQAATGILRGIGQIYGEQTQMLNQGVRDAHGQLLTMNKSIDDMQQRTDRMRVSLKLQGEELMMSLQTILRQLSDTGDTLSDTVDQVLRDQADANLKKIG